MNLQTYPAPSRRSVLLADHGVVATGQPLAAQAGLGMLLAGGNAVDAAIATAAALTVLEPNSNGLGSDAFALVWDGQRLHGLNGSGRWPQAMSAAALREAGHTAVPNWGWSGVTVPGAVDVWHTLHERFGRLPIDRVLAPAIDYAEQGFPVSPVVATMWRQAFDTYGTSTDPALTGWRQTFTRQGQTPEAGQRWISPGHARGLKLLADHGLRDFYQGQIAEELVNYSRHTGGRLSRDDLADHHSEWVEPISIRYRDCEVWEIPPNGQGIAALIALGLIDGSLAEHDYLSVDHWHRQIEAMKLGFADGYRYVADPAHSEVPAAGLLDPAYLAERRRLIGDTARQPEPGRPPSGGTVYLCAADRAGMMVSFIQSNYMGFGSGVVVPDLGLSLQNRGAGFTLQQGHPNEAAPGKRPRHTILPGFLTRNGQALGPFGVMGGEMQPQGHLQVVSAMLDYGLNPQAALDAPRWQLGGGLEVRVEPETPTGLIDALRAKGHQITVADHRYDFGRGQIIVRLDNGSYAAGSEPRTDGAAVGW